ncbi:MAG: AAA family ATPase [Myxococcota bacterium]
MPAVLRPHAEVQFAAELAALAAADTHPRPPSWRLSPWSVKTYLLGGTLPDGFTVTPKYIGSPRLMEIAIATLATDRALLLVGAPGTAKSWVSEHLAAAISNDSTRLVQGTAGVDDPALRYGWNYARLLAEGPSANALVPSPIFTSMRDGQLARIEELTRIPAEVMDSLITILSEKVLPIPELGQEIAARPGFNVIATANTRDRGVNELSAALTRRFNVVVLPAPESLEQEVAIVERRVADMGRALALPAEAPALDEVRRVVTIFRELRDGKTADGKTKIKSPSGSLSTADAIAVMTQGMSLAAHFGDGALTAADLAGALEGAIIKDPTADRVAWEEYLRTVVKERDGWKDLYRACHELLG